MSGLTHTQTQPHTHTLYGTEKNNIHIHEVSVVLHTFGTKCLIHTNGIFPKSNMCPATVLTRAVLPDISVETLHLQGFPMTCQVRCHTQPGLPSGETTPGVQATLCSFSSFK